MVGLVELTIFKAIDGKGDEWYLVEPKDVPEWLKSPDVIEFLMSGCVAQAPGEEVVYAGLRSGSSGEVNPLAEIILLNQHGQPIH